MPFPIKANPWSVSGLGPCKPQIVYGGKNFHPSQQQKPTLISIAAKKGI
jgi:hypothetical protein